MASARAIGYMIVFFLAVVYHSEICMRSCNGHLVCTNYHPSLGCQLKLNLLTNILMIFIYVVVLDFVCA